MEEIRIIVHEELVRLHEVNESKGGLNQLENHPFFGNPEKMYNYAMEWMEKAQKLGHFHQLVGIVLWNMDSSEEKIEQLRALFKEYMKFK